MFPDVQNIQNFNPSNPAQIVAAVIFYSFLAISVFFSLSAIYSLVKYSKSRFFGFVISGVYIFIYLSLISAGIAILGSIK